MCHFVSYFMLFFAFVALSEDGVVEKTQKIRDLGALKIGAHFGDLKIEPTLQGRVEVFAHWKAPERIWSSKEAPFFIHFKNLFLKSEMEIQIKWKKNISLKQRQELLKSGEYSVNLLVRAPREWSLDLYQKFGQVKIHHWAGKIKLRSLIGDIFLEEIDSEILELFLNQGHCFLNQVRGSILMTQQLGVLKIKNLYSQSAHLNLGKVDTEIKESQIKSLHLQGETNLNLDTLSSELSLDWKNGLIRMNRWSGSLSGAIENAEFKLKIDRLKRGATMKVGILFLKKVLMHLNAPSSQKDKIKINREVEESKERLKNSSETREIGLQEWWESMSEALLKIFSLGFNRDQPFLEIRADDVSEVIF